MNRIKLVNFLESYGDGIHGTPNYENNGEYCFINGNNLRDDRILLNDTNRISKEEYIRIKRPIYTNSLLLSINGTLGNVAKYNGEKIALGKSVCYLNIKRDYNRDFFFYLIKTKEFQTYIQLVAHGSTIKNLAPSQVAQYEFEMPKNINKLSDTLSLIDSKISLNNKIISELESMAKTIYDYWFLQFEFPNEEGKPYKSSGGKMVWNEELKREIPEGWTVDFLKNSCNCVLGGTPSTKKKEYWDRNINWINSGSVNNLRVSTCTKKITQLGYDNTSTYLMPKNTVVLAITGATLGQISILNIDSCANQSVVGILETKSMPTEYLYPSLKSYINTLMNNKTGAAQPHINKNDIENFKIIVPSESIMEKYYDFVHSMYEKINCLDLENIKLASLRDFLLPLLMNGQVGFNEGE